MKLAKKDIINVNTWLKVNGIKYLDVRVELLDHLVTEYEAIDEYPDLESFLDKRLSWCKKVMKKKENATHWGYQKMLWTRFFQLLKKPLIVIFWALFLILIIAEKPLLAWEYKYILFLPLLASACTHICIVIRNNIGKEIFKNTVSAKYLGNIFALPILIISLLNLVLQFNKILFFEVTFLFFYVMIGTTLYFSAILVFLKKRKEVLEQYDRLLG